MLVEEKYNQLSQNERETLHKLFQNEKTGTANFEKLKKVVYKATPPTPEQFLDPNEGWLTKRFVEAVYEHVQADFLEILNKNINYSEIVEYGCTRQGKTFLARLLMMYTIVYIHYLRDPTAYYQLAPTTHLALYLLCFKYEKTKQLLMKPFYTLLDQSPRFKKIKFQAQVPEDQYVEGLDIIIYSRAADVGEITLASGLQIMLGNDDPLSIIGSDVIQMYVSEIAFFIEHTGATEEEIFRLYTEGQERIEATVKNQYLAFTYLDTSANNADSVIENYILKKLSNKKGVFFRKRARWEARPYLFPIWQRTEETFKVITGDSNIPASIVRHPKQLKDIPEDLIMEVPIDAKNQFETNLLTAIKNIGGRPASSESQFIGRKELIDNLFDCSALTNIEGIVIADSEEAPEKYLWNKLADIFFTKFDGVNFLLKRAAREPRYIGLDLAHAAKGDLYGIAMLHKEWFRTIKQVIYVIDFAFPVGPGKNGINLEAVQFFIMDLAYDGRVMIQECATDKFQSENTKQFLTRKNIKICYQSVDADIQPYQFLLTCLLSGVIKAGKNVFLKNNLKSLHRVAGKKGEIIDHSKGVPNNKYLGDFDHSFCGQHAKDVSDAVAHALYLAFNDEMVPTTIYEDENRKFLNPRNLAEKEENKVLAYSALHKLY